MRKEKRCAARLADGFIMKGREGRRVGCRVPGANGGQGRLLTPQQRREDAAPMTRHVFVVCVRRKRVARHGHLRGPGKHTGAPCRPGGESGPRLQR